MSVATLQWHLYLECRHTLLPKVYPLLGLWITGGDLKTGYMEKRIGEHSTRQSLPESWKWQKRYWVLSEPKGLLYYFKSADDPPTYRGIINIRECRVEDVDANGMPKTNNARSKYDLDGGGGTVSLLIKVSHKASFNYWGFVSCQQTMFFHCIKLNWYLWLTVFRRTWYISPAKAYKTLSGQIHRKAKLKIEHSSALHCCFAKL